MSAERDEMSCLKCGTPTLFDHSTYCINCRALPTIDRFNYDTDGADWFKCGACGETSSFTDPASYLDYDGDKNAYQVLSYRCPKCGVVYDMQA